MKRLLGLAMLVVFAGVSRGQIPLYLYPRDWAAPAGSAEAQHRLQDFKDRMRGDARPAIAPEGPKQFENVIQPGKRNGPVGWQGIVPSRPGRFVPKSQADRDWERLRRKSKLPTQPSKGEKHPWVLRLEHEVEADRKLKYAKQIRSDAIDATGSEQRRLVKLLHDRLWEIVENFPGTDAAAEAETILQKEAR